jgi:hypothetical protein
MLRQYGPLICWGSCDLLYEHRPESPMGDGYGRDLWGNWGACGSQAPFVFRLETLELEQGADFGLQPSDFLQQAG